MSKLRFAGTGSGPTRSSARTLNVWRPGFRLSYRFGEEQLENFDFGRLPFVPLGFTSLHWKPVTAPGAVKPKRAERADLLTFAVVIVVPFGGPKVATT